MADKRRKMRVQGGWAPKRNKAETSKSGDVAISEKTDNGQSQAVAHSSRGQLIFKPTVKTKKEKPDVKIIDEDGEYNISEGPHGLSTIQLCKNFIEQKETEWIMEQLVTEIPWEEKEIKIFGKKCLQPRLTAWYGDFPYTYSRLTLKPFQWSPTLNILRDKIEAKTGLKFNSMLANLYRDHKDSVDWHSDDEKSLGINPIIASLSFGDTRSFELKRKPLEEEENGEDCLQKIKIPLTDGSLLIMRGATQHDWVHRVAKEYHDRGPRINLTFRNIHPK
ncbi:alpha-ketoglutarate-dependent dioxygenase alkB homolog 3-like isoform X2 [Rhopilema esculentum]|eukprot:gene5042-152_t